VRPLGALLLPAFFLCAASAADVQLEGAPVQGALLSGRAPAGASLALDGQPVAVAPDGRFLIGLDRDRSAPVILEARLPDGRAIRREIAVAARTWPVQNVDLPRPAAPDPAYLRMREGALARSAAARAAGSDSLGWRQPFIWPARGRISGAFGSQRLYRGVPAAFHAGLDIAAGAGAAVVAPADGVVVLAGPPAFSLEGNLVILDHGMGLNSAFLHLSNSVVTVGQRVRQGQAIGTVGRTGRATGPHLHWALRWREARVDPAPLVGAPPR
jgi:murein DD-endopeptidase MepM/ murein hydrolase activator NlpD